MDARTRRLYRAAGLAMAAAFAAAGAVVVLAPEATLAFFDALGRRWGFAEAPASAGPWVALSGAYLYAVAAMAWGMFRAPEQPLYPLLLCQAKGASAALLLLTFFFRAPVFAALVKGIVDALICLFVFGTYLLARGRRKTTPG
jgi:hypothetical protein